MTSNDAHFQPKGGASKIEGSLEHKTRKARSVEQVWFFLLLLQLLLLFSTHTYTHTHVHISRIVLKQCDLHRMLKFVKRWQKSREAERRKTGLFDTMPKALRPLWRRRLHCGSSFSFENNNNKKKAIVVQINQLMIYMYKIVIKSANAWLTLALWTHQHVS